MQFWSVTSPDRSTGSQASPQPGGGVGASEDRAGEASKRQVRATPAGTMSRGVCGRDMDAMPQSTRTGGPKLLFFYLRRAGVSVRSKAGVERRRGKGLFRGPLHARDLAVDNVAQDPKRVGPGVVHRELPPDLHESRV